MIDIPDDLHIIPAILLIGLIGWIFWIGAGLL